MWKDEVRQRYFWIGISDDFDNLVKELVEIELDEEVDLFRLKMHIQSKEDLDVFEPGDQEEIRHLLLQLLKDTERHSRNLARVVKVLNGYKAKAEGLKTR